MLPDKACAVVLSSEQRPRILLFRHPQAGVQLVKGSIERGETPDRAALRELAEESGISAATIEDDLGCWNSGHQDQIWSFQLCRPLAPCLNIGHIRRSMILVTPSRFSGLRSTIYLMRNATRFFVVRWSFCARFWKRVGICRLVSQRVPLSRVRRQVESTANSGRWTASAAGGIGHS